MSFVIYPAIDLRGGKVVRLKEGDPSRLTAYGDDPAETARRWLRAGTRWLHVVNLDGALGEPSSQNRSALEAILGAAGEFRAQVQFGGGVRSLEEIEQTLEMGVSRVILGTVAIENPNVVAQAVKRFGWEHIAVGIDARDGRVRTRGWREKSEIAAIELARRMQRLGLRTVIFTDVSRDGMGSGLNIPATRALAELGGLEVIASGGVHTFDDVIAARKAKLAGVIIGRALYEGTINLESALNTAGQG